MPLFVRRPQPVEARRFDGVQDPTLATWLGEWFDDWLPKTRELRLHVGLKPVTLKAGDWIVRMPNGSFIPFSADLFAATYEPLDGGN